MLPHMFFANPPVVESIVPILSTSISFKLLISIPTFSRRLIFPFADGWSCKLFSDVVFFSCWSGAAFEMVCGLFGSNDVGVSASSCGLTTIE